MKLMEVSVEDVYPDENNPRTDFGDIAALAESFDLNPERPGEPFNPPVLVADGGIYRIVDGERRYRAVKANKLRRMMAYVCEDMDDADAMVAMLATDDKMALSEAERSRGVQQMLLLGVDPEKVEKAARLEPGQAARVRRARGIVDDYGDDMSLFRLMAIDDNADDPEAVERLKKCSEKDFPAVLKAIEADRADRERRAEMEAACAEAGVALADGAPAGLRWRATVGSPADVAAEAAAMPDGYAAVLAKRWTGWAVEFYAPAAEEAPDPEDAERDERARELESAATAAEEAQRAWLAEAAMGDAVTGLLLARMFDAGSWEGVRSRELAASFLGIGDGEEAEPRGTMTGWFFAWAAASHLTHVAHRAGAVAHGDGYAAGAAGRWLEQLAAMEADGYGPGDADLAVRAALESYLAELGNGGEE